MTSLVPVKGLRGQEQALCTCADCCAEAVVSAAHGDHNRFTAGRGRRTNPVLVLRNEGQVITKLQSDGWSYVKRVLRCPKCEAERKAKEPEMAQTIEQTPKAIAPARQPTPKQTRLIILALEDAYDDAAKRYKNSITDKTLAEDLGDGILPGWVAEQREKLFGPAGNEELDAIRADIERLRAIVEGLPRPAQPKLQD